MLDQNTKLLLLRRLGAGSQPQESAKRQGRPCAKESVHLHNVLNIHSRQRYRLPRARGWRSHLRLTEGRQREIVGVSLRTAQREVFFPHDHSDGGTGGEWAGHSHRLKITGPCRVLWQGSEEILRLDVHFISSPPVESQSDCRVWEDRTHAQSVSVGG